MLTSKEKGAYLGAPKWHRGKVLLPANAMKDLGVQTLERGWSACKADFGSEMWLLISDQKHVSGSQSALQTNIALMGLSPARLFKKVAHAAAEAPNALRSINVCGDKTDDSARRLSIAISRCAAAT